MLTERDSSDLERAKQEAQKCYDGTNCESRHDAPAWEYLLGYADWMWEVELIKRDRALARGGRERMKRAYQFKECSRCGGKAMDWPCGFVSIDRNCAGCDLMKPHVHRRCNQAACRHEEILMLTEAESKNA